MTSDAAFTLAVLAILCSLACIITVACYRATPKNLGMNIPFVADLGHAPVRGSVHAAASDLRADQDYTLEPGESVAINLKVRTALPVGTVGILAVRSSIGRKGLSLANQIGVIDSDYRGFLVATIRNDSTETHYIDAFERICQFMVLPHITPNWVQVDTLDHTERGDGGFGSTGTDRVVHAATLTPSA